MERSKKRNPRDVEKHLRKLAGPRGITLLNAMFDRLSNPEQGIDGERLRIDFEDHREEIERLRRMQFVKESFDPKRTYRLTPIGLALANDDRAKSLLALLDRLLAYQRSAYGKEPGRQITLQEVSEALSVPEAAAAQALDIVNESPASASRSNGYPLRPDWYFIPNEQSLDYPNLNAILRQMAEWAERGSWGPKVVRKGEIIYPDGPRRFRIGEHKALLIGIGAGTAALLGLLANAATVIGFVQSLFVAN